MWATLIIVVAPIAAVAAWAVRLAQREPQTVRGFDADIEALHTELLRDSAVGVVARRR